MSVYLIKSCLLWTAFLLFYFLFLSREKTHGHNRLYLWLSLLLGLAIPLINNPFTATIGTTVNTLPVNFDRGVSSARQSLESAVSPTASEYQFDCAKVIFFIWLAGVIFQAIILAIAIFKIYSLKKKSSSWCFEQIYYFKHKSVRTPFSFGGTIFLPIENYEPGALKLILEHEQRHFRYYHWLDNLLLAGIQILFWFHPLFYLLKRQIRLTHEFQVDGDVAPQDQYDYGKLLLAQNQLPTRHTLIHTFYYSPLKKRIAMMTKTKKTSAWKLALTLPLFAGCFLLMSASNPSKERVTKGNITYRSRHLVTYQISLINFIGINHFYYKVIKDAVFCLGAV